MEQTEVTPVSARVTREVGPGEMAGSLSLPPAPPPAPAPLPMVGGATPVTWSKTRKGRPSKYAPPLPARLALSPMPIIRVPWDYTGETQTEERETEPYLKKQKFDFLDQPLAIAGADYKTDLVTVNAGEDVITKIHSFLQEPQSICVSSASGSISRFTIRRPASAGGSLTYEGCFELVTLNGSFMAADTVASGMKRLSGGLSICVLAPNGNELGGSLSGPLVAASPVQVVVGTFLPGKEMGKNLKKKKRPVPFDIFPRNFNLITSNIVYLEGGFERSHGDETQNSAAANATMFRI